MTLRSRRESLHLDSYQLPGDCPTHCQRRETEGNAGDLPGASSGGNVDMFPKQLKFQRSFNMNLLCTK